MVGGGGCEDFRTKSAINKCEEKGELVRETLFMAESGEDMESLNKLDLAANSEYSSMNEEQRAAVRFALELINSDKELLKAIQLYAAVLAIDAYEHSYDVLECNEKFAIMFDGPCSEINEEPYDEYPGTLPDLMIKAGELAKAALQNN